MEAMMKNFMKNMSKEDKQKMMREFMNSMTDEERTEMMQLMNARNDEKHEAEHDDG